MVFVVFSSMAPVRIVDSLGTTVPYVCHPRVLGAFLLIHTFVSGREVRAFVPYGKLFEIMLHWI